MIEKPVVIKKFVPQHLAPNRTQDTVQSTQRFIKQQRFKNIYGSKTTRQSLLVQKSAYLRKDRAFQNFEPIPNIAHYNFRKRQKNNEIQNKMKFQKSDFYGVHGFNWKRYQEEKNLLKKIREQQQLEKLKKQSEVKSTRSIEDLELNPEQQKIQIFDSTKATNFNSTFRSKSTKKPRQKNVYKSYSQRLPKIMKKGEYLKQFYPDLFNKTYFKAAQSLYNKIPHTMENKTSLNLYGYNKNKKTSAQKSVTVLNYATNEVTKLQTTEGTEDLFDHDIIQVGITQDQQDFKREKTSHLAKRVLQKCQVIPSNGFKFENFIDQRSTIDGHKSQTQRFKL